MKFLVVLALFGFGVVLGAPEAPAGPYAPSGWRPKGPAFELPTEVEKQPTQEYGAPEQKAEVEVTEEEVQYAGDIATTEATTPFLEYGPPATDSPDEEGSTPPSEEDDDLSVQGLPGTEAAAEFRTTPRFETNQRFTARRNQRFQNQNVPLFNRQNFRQEQRPAQFKQQPFAQQNQFQRQQLASFSGNFQPNPRQQFATRTQAVTTQSKKGFNQRIVSQQFGRLVAAPVQNLGPKQAPSKSRALPVFNQRFTGQRQVALDSYGAPVQSYGPPTEEYAPPTQEYGPPTQEYGPPTEAPQGEQEVEQPEDNAEVPEVEYEDTTEPNDDENDAGPNIAISTAVATGRYVQPKRSSRRLQNQRVRGAPARITNFQQLNEPVYMYNQFGQLVRIY